MANEILLSTLPAQTEITENHKEKKDLTDAQLCGWIIYWFHHFPHKTYLTTDEIFNRLSTFCSITKDRLRNILWGMSQGLGISHGTFENKDNNIPLEERWEWSIKMAIENGKSPTHQVTVWNS